MSSQNHAPTFDVAQIPFSHHGSWLNISAITAEHVVADDLHLITHQTGFHPVLALIPWIDAARVPTTISARPSALSWHHPDGRIDVAFEAADTVRLRGTGVGMRFAAATGTLTPFSGSYFFTNPADGSHTWTSYETGRRYRITALHGAVTADGDQALGPADRAVTVTPDGADGHWEVAVEEMTAARTPYAAAQAFDRVSAAAAAHFASFADDIAPWRSARTPAAELAAYVLWSATVRAAGFLARDSVLMSKHWMDKVWSWDHCFNGMALAAGRPAAALDQFLTPFDHQDEAGALPDSVTHSEILYNFVKPPIHGWALTQIRARMADDFDPATLLGLYSALSRWMRFWLDARRAPGHRLAHYQHGNDSGWDNATAFDGTRVAETADLAGFMVQTSGVLAGLADELGLDAESAGWADQADALRTAMLGELWDGTRFVTRDPLGGQCHPSRSLLNLLPIAIGDQLPEPVREQLAATIREHLTPWGLATEPPSSPEYRPDGYWRGPIWAPSTVLVEDGLRRAGYVELADDISTRFRALCEKSGFAENFDALTGDGLRDRAYTWTASAYLLLAGDAERRTRSVERAEDPAVAWA